MAGSRPHRTRNRILIAVAALVVVVVGVGALGVYAGWFDTGSKIGNLSGFVRSAAPDAGASPAAWPGFGNTPASTRSNTALAAGPPFTERWTVDTGSLVELPPVIGGGRVVVGTNHGMAIAIDLRSGAVEWRRSLGGIVAASPALTGLPNTASAGAPELDLFVTIAGELIALNPTTGAVEWRLDLGSPIESSPLVIGDGVFVGTRSGGVVRVSLARRAVVWSHAGSGAVKGALAESGDNVIVGDYGGHVSALNQTTGARVWTTTSPGTVLHGAGRFYAGPAVAYGRVYIGNVNGRILGMDASTGAVNWIRVVSDWVYSSAAVADRMVFAGSWNHSFYALDAVTGKVIWQHDLGQPISGSPSVIGHLVWVSTLGKPVSAGHTYAFDIASGRQVVFRPLGRYAAAVGVAGSVIVTGVRTITALTPHGGA